MSKEERFFHVSLKVLLRNEAGQTLVLSCEGDGSMTGYWDFPGGRINTGEKDIPLEKIIRREVAEEIDPEVDFKISLKSVAVARHIVPKRFHDLGFDLHEFLVLFTGQYLGGKIKTSFEHREYKWIDLEKERPEDWFMRGVLELAKNYLAHK